MWNLVLCVSSRPRITQGYLGADAVIPWRQWGRYLDWTVAGLLRRWRTPRTLGERGEQVAARYLARRGYRILARRARDRLGEIDLVAVEGRTLVFVEVKTRRTHQPEVAVDARKQRQLTRAALSFLKRHDLLECASRFDVIAIRWPERGRPEVRHYRHAFQAQGPPGQMFA